MKYVYGAMFALTVGLLAFLILSMYVTTNVALIVAVLIAVIIFDPSTDLMSRETLRENLLKDDDDDD